ncbi:MAG: sigma 54-interacting transcriptional regulator [Planctomycetes bacterium]|nr:sigma 54-interacting transcriptional regulator [Planctomycetota bacterium]
MDPTPDSQASIDGTNVAPESIGNSLAIATDEFEALRAIVEGTAHSTGVEFFRTLVRHLANAVGVRYAFVAEFADATTQTRARTIAYWTRDRIAENVEWDLAGTPCEDVVWGGLCHHPVDVWRKFPEDTQLIEWNIESYLGVPLSDGDGRILGHLAVFDDRPMPEEPRKLLIFRIFAGRAAAELARLRLEQELRDSEQRFRDLYEEAPIAYVKEDMESRFISANRAAVRILGIRPEEVPGTIGKSFIPETPDAQRRFHEAFASVGRGTDTSGVTMELRRKDNGKPIWIQWWSKPEPGGKYTRTMFVDITDRILAEQERTRLTAQNLYLQEEIKSVHNFDEIIGQSPAVLETLEKVNRVAKTDATVLITGETGTGKELIARAIHSISRRRDKPLIKLNCAALPSSLVESELFGHEKGAFSGAITQRIGRFELANGGTIFLDEIGEVPMEVQVKLLRVLQEREFERVGGTESIKVDVRVISATNRDLQKAITEGKFREDLYYRLNVFPVSLPPLRSRAGDIPLLVQFLVGKFSARVGIRIDSIGHETMERLCSYTWPGNVRELENVLERAIILSTGPTLEIDPKVFSAVLEEDPPETLTGVQRSSESSAGSSDSRQRDGELESLSSNERNHILAVLAETNWVIDGPRGAARILEMHPNTLRSRMKKLGIVRSSQ